MADSAGIIPSKNSEKSKLSNSINRTTSETLRLNETERVLTQPNSLTSSTPRKKTSFIITSITSRTSNDAGEDSADDLDESHTEDISEIVDNSRITDIENETPSYSEDTFSKDDVFFNASSSLVSAPVIPTSSQYGLALVPTSENSENILNPSDSSEHSENPDLRVEVNESVINLGVVSTKHDPEMRDMHPPAPRTERFKVVKIESTEPFKRGRWICMDYLDHPNIAQNASTNNTKSDSECSLHHPPSEASDTLSITNSAASVVGVPNLGDDQKQQQLTNINNIINSEVSNQLNMQPSDNGQLVNNQTMPITTPSNIPSNYSSVSPGQSLQNNLQMSQPLVNSASPVQPPPPQQQQQQPPPQQSQSQSLSQAHIQQILANSNTHTSLQPQQIQQVLAGTAIPQQAQQPVPAQQPPPQQQQPPPQQPQQPQMQSQQSMPQQPQQQQMMQPQGIPQQIPTMTQYQPQPQAQQNMAQQQQYQPMQQQPQPQMMQQQMQPQQNMQPQMPTVQQVHMQPSVQQNMQQMPMQQQQQQGQQPQIMPQQMQQLTQQMPQQVSYSQQIPQTQQSGVTQTSSQGMMPAMHPQMQNYQQNQMLPNMQPQPIMNIQSQPHLQPQYYTNTMPQSGPMMNSQGGMMPPMSQAGNVGQVNMQTTSTLQPLQSYPVSQPLQQVPGMPQTPPVQTSMPNYTLQMSMSQPTPMQPMSQPLPSLAMQQQPMNYSVPASQGYPQVSSVPSSSIDVRSVIAADRSQESIPAPTAALLESLAEVTAAGDEQPVGEDQDSASGASAVAIDNKIEQAMDLVKSHLMFAVREEVEVLKEKIAELMERITQLESENSLLRASANPDTLAQISSTQSSQASNPP